MRHLTKSRITGPLAAASRRVTVVTAVLARRPGGFLGSIFQFLVLSWGRRPTLRSAASPLQATSIVIMIGDIIHDPVSIQEKVVPPPARPRRACAPQPVTISDTKSKMLRLF